MKVKCTLLASAMLLFVGACSSQPYSGKPLDTTSDNSWKNKSKNVELPDWVGPLFGGEPRRPTLRDEPAFLMPEEKAFAKGEEVLFGTQYLTNPGYKAGRYAVKVTRKPDLVRYDYETQEFVAYRLDGSTFGRRRIPSGFECWDDVNIATSQPATWIE